MKKTLAITLLLVLRCDDGIAIEYWDLSVSDMIKSLYRLSTGEELYDLSGL